MTRFLAIRLLAAVAVLVAVCPAGLAQSSAYHWVSVSPEGGIVRALAVDPRTPSTIYAGGFGGVFKSVNGGASWVFSGLSGANVSTLAVDPVQTSTLYAGANKGVFKSNDGGATWTKANAGLSATAIFALVLDPQASATVYAGTGGGVFKSTDGAASWTTASDGLGAQPVNALAVDPKSPSTIYAGTTNAGVFRSTDGAATWTAATSGLTPTLIHSLAVDPKTPSTIYAGTNSGLFKSTDGAASWTAVGGQPSNFFALAIDPVTPSTVYGGTGGQVLKSANGVMTNWQRATTGLPPQIVWALAIDPVTPSNLYVGSQTGLFRSTDGGVTCSVANSGFTPLRAYALAVDPAAPSTLYEGGETGIFKSMDGGRSWTLATNTPFVRVWSLVVLPGSSAILAGTDSGGFRSTDGGVTWTPGVTLFPTYAYAIDPNSPSTVYAVGVGGVLPSGQQLGAIGESTDGGMTWNFFVGDTGTFPPAFNAVAVNPSSSSSVLVIGTDAGIWGTRTGGHGGLHLITNSALASRAVFAVAEDPVSRAIVYAGTDNGLYKSTDGGLTFGTQVTNGLTASGIYALLFDPTSPSTFYAGTNVGVFVSADAGASWAPMNVGLTNPVVNALVRAPGPSGALYAATNGSGVFLFTNEVERPPVTLAKHPGPPRQVRGPLDPPTGLHKEASPSRNLVWTPPDNLTPSDAVTYKLWITGGASCANGCLYHPAAPSWYTMGSENGAGSYTWQLQAVSATRPYSLPVNGPPFTLP